MNTDKCEELIEKEFHKQYIERFGKEALENYFSYYTDDEQIERYTNNLLFWLERIPKITFKSNYRFNTETFSFDYFYENEKKIVIESELKDIIKWNITTSKIIFLLDKLEDIGKNYVIEIKERPNTSKAGRRRSKTKGSEAKKIISNKDYIIKNVINNLNKQYSVFMNEFNPFKLFQEKYKNVDISIKGSVGFNSERVKETK
jgi:hypothetical protein